MAEGDLATIFVLAFFALLIWGAVKLARRPKRYSKRFVPREAADHRQRNKWFHKSRYGLSDARELIEPGRCCAKRHACTCPGRGALKAPRMVWPQTFIYFV